MAREQIFINIGLSDFCVELSQDVASKGLGLVYELGNEQDQQELVSTLVETLMTGKRYGELENFRFEHAGQVLYTPRICSERRKVQLLSFLFIKPFLNCKSSTAMLWTAVQLSSGYCLESKLNYFSQTCQ